MGPYFPSGHRELADWSGDSVIDNVAGLPRRQPDSPEEQEVLVLIAQVDKELFLPDIYSYLDACVKTVPETILLLSRSSSICLVAYGCIDC